MRTEGAIFRYTNFCDQISARKKQITRNVRNMLSQKFLGKLEWEVLHVVNFQVFHFSTKCEIWINDWIRF